MAEAEVTREGATVPAVAPSRERRQLAGVVVTAVTRDVALFCVAFAVLRAWASLARPPVSYPDTATYTQLNFLGHNVGRLWTVPLLYTVVPNDSARTFVQLLLGIVSWSALALAISVTLSRPVVARVAAVLVLLLGLCIQVTQWDQVLLSESLALSLTALLVALLLWVRLRQTAGTLAAMFVVLVLWVFDRQLQATLFIGIAVVAAVWIVARHRRFLPLAAALAILAAWGGYATNNSSAHLTRWGAHDLMVMRILPSAVNASYFTSRGMPDVPLMEKEAAKRLDRGWADPVLQDPRFLSWVDAHWQRVYAGWLLRNPVATARDPVAQAPNLLSGLNNYSSVRPALPSSVQDTLWQREVPAGDLIAFVVVAILLWAASLRAGAWTSLDTLAALLFAISVVWYYAGYYGVVSELPRILTPPAALMRISLLLLAFAGVDRLVLARAAAGIATRPGASTARARPQLELPARRANVPLPRSSE